jgi:dihydrodipicolinate synthase/N-acetylneuraminate lyase
MTSAANPPCGTWGAVMLAISANEQIDWGATGETIARLAASGVDGLYTNGTACEFHLQTEDEFDRLSDLTASIAKSANIPFQIGISQSNPRIARARAERVRALGPSGLQFTLPDWWPPTLDEVLRFTTGLAETANGVPLILYNPPHAKRRLSLSEIATLRAAVPSLIGAKLPGGDAAWFAEMREKLPGFSVFIPGHTLATGYAQGAWGSYSNVACLSPKGAVAWWRAIEADDPAAKTLEIRIQAFMADHVVPMRTRYGVSDAALDKAMAASGGWGALGPRLLWPYSSVPDEHIQHLALVAHRTFPEWFGELST